MAKPASGLNWQIGSFRKQTYKQMNYSIWILLLTGGINVENDGLFAVFPILGFGLYYSFTEGVIFCLAALPELFSSRKISTEGKNKDMMGLPNFNHLSTRKCYFNPHFFHKSWLTSSLHCMPLSSFKSLLAFCPHLNYTGVKEYVVPWHDSTQKHPSVYLQHPS